MPLHFFLSEVHDFILFCDHSAPGNDLGREQARTPTISSILCSLSTILFCETASENDLGQLFFLFLFFFFCAEGGGGGGISNCHSLAQASTFC